MDEPDNIDPEEILYDLNGFTNAIDGPKALPDKPLEWHTDPVSYETYSRSFLFSLLPAGSIIGAPKKKTMEIIAEAETYQRGFYTGVMGYFDGRMLDSSDIATV